LPCSKPGFLHIEIDATGHAAYVVTPTGAHGDPTDPTATARTVAAELGEEGPQDLLARLDALGVFSLADAEAEFAPGASIDLIEVTLSDGDWRILNVDFDVAGASRLDLAQALIVAAVEATATDRGTSTGVGG